MRRCKVTIVAIVTDLADRYGGVDYKSEQGVRAFDYELIINGLFAWRYKNIGETSYMTINEK